MKLPKHQLSVEILADTAKEDTRTIDVTFYSGAEVKRYSWMDGAYFLQFSMDPKHVRLDRINSGGAVLNAHSDWSLGDVLGVVEKAWIENGQGKATLRFSDRADVQPIWADIKNKIIRKVSMGAVIHKLKDLTKEDEKIKRYLAVDWEPLEISPVPIPADPGAGFLAADTRQELFEVEVENLRADARDKEKVMEETNNTAGSDAAKPRIQLADDDAAKMKKEAIEEDRKRMNHIRTSLKLAKLDGDQKLADECLSIERPLSVEQAGEKILNRVYELSNENPIRTHVLVTRDADATRMAAIEVALLHRYQPGTYKLDEPGRQYVGMSLLEICKECLTAHGISFRGVSKLEVVRLGLMSTSDFPNILANLAGKSLRAAYEGEQQTWRPIATQNNAPDFKTRTINQFGDAPNLAKVNESGEFTYGSIPEAKESYALATYGKIVALTRQAIVNDDLGAFTRIPAMQGAACSRLESDVVWLLITGNPTMGDGAALFVAAGHANYTSSGTAISVASLGVARAMMRNQKGLINADLSFSYLNIVPRYLAVPPALETIAQQYTLLVNPNIASSVNPFQGSLSVIAEPRLEVADANGWYLFASPSQVPIIEFAYLEGQQGPFLETRMGFEVDGMELKVREDFGAQIIDFRGAYYNVGA